MSNARIVPSSLLQNGELCPELGHGWAGLLICGLQWQNESIVNFVNRMPSKLVISSCIIQHFYL